MTPCNAVQLLQALLYVLVDATKNGEEISSAAGDGQALQLLRTEGICRFEMVFCDVFCSRAHHVRGCGAAR